MKDNSVKKMHWLTLALMSFVPLWGFNNITQGFFYYNGMGAIIPWIVVLVLYFLPYALMVGEMGAVFKKSSGGVSSWVNQTMGRRIAFYAGWTYWVVHTPYLAQKPTRILVALGWLFSGNGNFVNGLAPIIVQGVALIMFIIAIFLTLRGLNFLKHLSSVVGFCSFFMSILFILMMFAAPAINKDVSFAAINWGSSDTWLSGININSLLNLSILILAVGGCEKMAPYVNHLEKPSKGFPKVMITLTIMVAFCALLGTIALAMMFPTGIQKEFLANGAYEAFGNVGNYYGVGNLFTYIYAILETLLNMTVIIVSIDAPLRVLLGSTDKEFVPGWLFKKNKKGVYINGVILVAIIVSILIIIPALGIGSVDSMIKYIIELNSICMPLRYLWVFLAYIMLKKSGEFANAEYTLTKNRGFGMLLGIWCFAITAYACVSQMVTVDYGTAEGIFKLVLNLLTPLILLGLGLILPVIARRSNGDVYIDGKYHPELDEYNLEIQRLKKEAAIKGHE